VTLPEWSADELERIATKFASKKMDAEAIKTLREELQAAGLSEFFPDAVERAIR
jgi:phosphopantothenate synthetase